MLGWVRRHLAISISLALVVVVGVVWWGWRTHQDRCGAGFDAIPAADFTAGLLPPEDLDVEIGTERFTDDAVAADVVSRREALLRAAGSLGEPLGAFHLARFDNGDGNRPTVYAEGDAVVVENGGPLPGTEYGDVHGRVDLTDGSTRWAGAFSDHRPVGRVVGDHWVTVGTPREGSVEVAAQSLMDGERVACTTVTTDARHDPIRAVATTGTGDLIVAHNGVPDDGTSRSTVVRLDPVAGDVAWTSTSELPADELHVVGDLAVLGRVSTDIGSTRLEEWAGLNSEALRIDGERPVLVEARRVTDGAVVWTSRDLGHPVAGVIGGDPESGVTVLLSVACPTEGACSARDTVATYVAVDGAGEVLWERPAAGAAPIAAVWGRHLVVARHGTENLTGIDLASGERAWRVPFAHDEGPLLQPDRATRVGDTWLVPNSPGILVVAPKRDTARWVELPGGIRQVHVSVDHVLLTTGDALLVFERSDTNP